MTVKLDVDKYIHGKNLLNHIKRQRLREKREIFKKILKAYETYRSKIERIDILDAASIREFVAALNEYRKYAVPIFDGLDRSGQQKLGSTIMEEFFYLLFSKKMILENLQHKNLYTGSGDSYVSLSFTPQSFSTSFSQPGAYIHRKNQDFILGASIDIIFVNEENEKTEKTVIPFIAIECKTYIERNMLDSCAATANRLKNAMPYCVYIVAAEYMKMEDAYPELTDIDEVYILCKAKNTDREQRKKERISPIDIDADLIIDLYYRVDRHLNAIWWKPEDALTLGKIINRPS